ncbi:MAG: TIGR02300 family protein [Rhodospirillales bacterium]|nr:TIGR02300 family protein [Rhodospirillales bacterium]
MAKPELGTKRVCPVTGRKFYDLNKTPVISPYTGEIVPIAAPPPVRARTEPAPARPVAKAPIVVAPETQDAEFVSLEDADAEAQGTKVPVGDIVEGDDDIEPAETIEDAAFIEEEEEGDADVTDIIGDGIEKEEET